MHVNQVAVQLYTLRDHLQTSAATVDTLKRVREIGYQAVEVAGLGAVATEDLARMLADQGLVCCATHEPGERILKEPEQVADRLDLLHCRMVAFPHPGKARFDSEADVAAFAKALDKAGAALRDRGVRLCYHNHHTEFQRVGGKTVLESIYEQTDPRFLQAELDTYWVQYGGGDPASWCKRMTGRLPILHLKDYAVSRDAEVVFAEVGSGNLDWNGTIAAADAAGCEWYVVEQDTCPGDPFDSIRKSYEYIVRHLCV